MGAFSKLKKITIISLGTLSLGGLTYYNYDNLFNNIPTGKSEGSHSYPTSKWDYNWDRRDAKSVIKSVNDVEDDKKNKKAIKAIRHIILIRHGQYNTDGKTDDERSLTKLGKLQAEVTGMRLKELNFPFTTIVRSTMKRAQETSELIQLHLPDVPVKDDSILVEGFPTPPEPPTGHWKPEKIFFQDGTRIEAAFRKYIHRADIKEEKDSYTVIVCHANVIRYFVCRALQLPPEAWLRMSLNHGSITWISVLPSGRVILRCFGETGHMFPEWITSR